MCRIQCRASHLLRYVLLIPGSLQRKNLPAAHCTTSPAATLFSITTEAPQRAFAHVELPTWHYLDFIFQPITEFHLMDLQVVVGLEVDPEAGGGAEVTGEPQGSIGGNGTLAVHDPAD